MQLDVPLKQNESSELIKQENVRQRLHYFIIWATNIVLGLIFLIARYLFL